MLILMTASKEEIARAHHAYLDGIADARGRIREHLPATGGPEADGSIESLLGIGAWFFERLPETAEATTTSWIPVWWNPLVPPAEGGVQSHAPLTRQQLRLVDEVHAYIAEVLMRQVRGAQWVVYKGSRENIRFGTTVIQLNKRRQFYPLSLLYKAALNAVLLDKPVEPTIFYDIARQYVGDGD